MATAFLDPEVSVPDFRMFLADHDPRGALDEQGFEVAARTRDLHTPLFPCTFVIGGREPCPGTEVLGCRKHVHVDTNLGNHGDGREDVVDGRNSHDQVDLLGVRHAQGKDDLLDLALAGLEVVVVVLDDAELSGLFGGDDSLDGELEVRKLLLQGLVDKRFEVDAGVQWIFQQLVDDVHRTLSEGIGNHAAQLDVRDGQAVLETVLLAGHEVCELETVAREVPKLPDRQRGHEASRDQVMLEEVGNPFGVLLVGLLAPDGLDIFGVGKDNLAGRLQDVEHRDPVFPRGLHADIFALILHEPL